MDAEMHENQADLSESLMWSLGLAKKLGLRVYIEIHVGSRAHGISVQGKDDPTLEYLYELANAQWKVSQEDALGAKLDDVEEKGGSPVGKWGRGNSLNGALK